MHGPDCRLGARLDACDHAFDLGCRLLGSVRQRPDFVGDHGKATAGFTGARSLDGSVERKQVGLACDRADDIQYPADLVGAGGQLFDFLRGGRDIANELPNGLQRIVDPLLTLAGGLVCTFGGIGGVDGIAGHFLHRCGHLVHGCGSLVDFGALLMQAAAGVFGHREQLFGRRGELVGGGSDAGNRLAQAVFHFGQGLQQQRGLVATRYLDDLVELTRGHPLGNDHRFAQRPHDTAGQYDGQCNHQYDDADDRRRDDREGLIIGVGTDLGGVGCAVGIVLGQLDQRLHHRVGIVGQFAVDQAGRLCDVVSSHGVKNCVLQPMVGRASGQEGVVQGPVSLFCRCRLVRFDLFLVVLGDLRDLVQCRGPGAGAFFQNAAQGQSSGAAQVHADLVQQHD